MSLAMAYAASLSCLQHRALRNKIGFGMANPNNSGPEAVRQPGGPTKDQHLYCRDGGAHDLKLDLVTSRRESI